MAKDGIITTWVVVIGFCFPFVVKAWCDGRESKELLAAERGHGSSQFLPPALPLPLTELTLLQRAPDAVSDYIHFRESTFGTNPKCRRGVVGEHGERGGYQPTPIFIEDVKDLFGFVVDPYDNEQCRYAIYLWLSYYAPRVGAETLDELYELFHRGAKGYQAWAKSKTT